MSDKVRGVTLTKMASLLGGGREVQARRPVRQVKFSLGSSFHGEYSSANFYMFGNFLARYDYVNYCVSIGSWHGILCRQKRDSAV